MARRLDLTFPHQLGAAEAKRRVAERIAALQAQFGAKIGGSEVAWTGDNASIRVKALGQTATSDVQVTDRTVHIHVDLPMLLSPLSGKIGGHLSGMAERALGGAAR